MRAEGPSFTYTNDLSYGQGAAEDSSSSKFGGLLQKRSESPEAQSGFDIGPDGETQIHSRRPMVRQPEEKGVVKHNNYEAESNPIMQVNGNLSTRKLSSDKGFVNKPNKGLEDLAGIVSKVDIVQKQNELDGLDIGRERLVDIINAGGFVKSTKIKAPAKWKRVLKGNINKENIEGVDTNASSKKRQLTDTGGNNAVKKQRDMMMVDNGNTGDGLAEVGNGQPRRAL